MANQWTAIKARVPDINRIVAPFEKEMNHYLDLVEKSFDSTVATFRHNKVSFDRTLERRGSGAGLIEIIGTIGTDNKVYIYLNNGTKVRYATMSKDFQAKTKVGRIKAGPGRGKLWFVSRAKPNKGIKPRKFDELIAKSRQRNFELAFKRAVDSAAKICAKY